MVIITFSSLTTPRFHVLGARCGGNPGTAQDPLCSPPAPASLKPQLQPLMTPPTSGNSQAQGSMHAKPQGVGCSESTTSPRTPLDKRGPHHMAKAKGAISTYFGSTEPHKINDFGKWQFLVTSIVLWISKPLCSHTHSSGRTLPAKCSGEQSEPAGGWSCTGRTDTSNQLQLGVSWHIVTVRYFLVCEITACSQEVIVHFLMSIFPQN